MLNLCLENATGQYCVLWSDDTWYAPHYLKTLMGAHERETLNLLRYKTCYSVSRKQAFMIEDDRVACPAWFRLYPARFADSGDFKPFADQFYRVHRSDADAQLVVKFVL